MLSKMQNLSNSLKQFAESVTSNILQVSSLCILHCDSISKRGLHKKLSLNQLDRFMFSKIQNISNSLQHLAQSVTSNFLQDSTLEN